MRVRWWLLSAVVVGCAPPPDGGADAGARDAGVFDAGIDGGRDAGTADAGRPDAGTPCAQYAITPPDELLLPRGDEATLTFTATGATFQVTGGELPPGMTFESWGVLTGAPTTAGRYRFELAAWNATCVANLEVTVEVECPVITVTPPSRSTVFLGDTFVGHFAQSGAAAPLFFVSDGALPPWALLTPDGVLTGQADLNGPFTFTVQAQDPDGCFGESPPFTLSVDCPDEQLIAGVFTDAGFLLNELPGWSSLLSFQRGVASDIWLQLVDLREARFSLVDGGLPPGVSFDGGFISGAPISIPTGSGRFVVRAEFQGCVYEETVTPVQCEYLGWPSPASWSVSDYVIDDADEFAGWVNGTNTHGDRQKGAFFDLSGNDYVFIDGVLVAFGHASARDPSHLVRAEVRNGSNPLSAWPLGTYAKAVGAIESDVQRGAPTRFSQGSAHARIPQQRQVFVSINFGELEFPAGSTAPRESATFTAIASGAALPDAGWDQLSVLSNGAGETVPSAIWEQHADGQWFQYGDAGAWNLAASLLIHPNACKQF